MQLFGVSSQACNKRMRELGENLPKNKRSRDPEKTVAFIEWLRKNNWDCGHRKIQYSEELDISEEKKTDRFGKDDDCIVKSGSFTVETSAEGLKSLLEKFTGDNKMVFFVSWYNPTDK